MSHLPGKTKSRPFTLALVLRSSLLVDALTDRGEIALLETSMDLGSSDPLASVQEFRKRKTKQEDDFSNYMETTLSRPGVKPEVKTHGLRWLESKNAIEKAQATEAEAALVVSKYAYQIYLQDPRRTDFTLVGPNAEVRIRVFEL